MRRVFVGLIALAFVFAGSAQAAELEDGAKELELNFAFTDVDELGKVYILNFGLGFMITSNHEVGPKLDYLSFDPEFGGSIDLGRAGGFYRYNFSTGNENLSPFVSVTAAFPFGDLDDVIDYSAGIDAGLRVMATDSAAINIRAFYDKQFGSNGVPDIDFTGLSAGLSIFF